MILMTHDTDPSMTPAVAAALGLAAVWVAAALWRPTATYHLAPILIVAVVPGVLWSSKRLLVRVTILGTLLAGTTATLLGALDLLRGASLLPIGDAYVESLVFAGATALAVLGAVSVPRMRSFH